MSCVVSDIEACHHSGVEAIQVSSQATPVKDGLQDGWGQQADPHLAAAPAGTGNMYCCCDCNEAIATMQVLRPIAAESLNAKQKSLPVTALEERGHQGRQLCPGQMGWRGSDEWRQQRCHSCWSAGLVPGCQPGQQILKGRQTEGDSIHVACNGLEAASLDNICHPLGRQIQIACRGSQHNVLAAIPKEL